MFCHSVFHIYLAERCSNISEIVMGSKKWNARHSGYGFQNQYK